MRYQLCAAAMYLGFDSLICSAPWNGTWALSELNHWVRLQQCPFVGPAKIGHSLALKNSVSDHVSVIQILHAFDMFLRSES